MGRSGHWVVRMVVAAALVAVGAVGALKLHGCGGQEGPPPLPAASVSLEAMGEGVKLSYLHAGEAGRVRVIYVHGTPGHALAFAGYLHKPLAGAESISVDRLGFGASTKGPGFMGYEDQARSLEPLLVEREGRWPILVGHSLGGPIVAMAAAMYPDRVGGLVIVSGNFDPALEEPRWFNHAGRLIGFMLPEKMQTANREIFAAPQEVLNLSHKLPLIRCPVVIVHGLDDSLVPYANALYLQKQLTGPPPDAVKLIAPKADHFLPWTHEPLIREAIESLLER